MRLIDADALEPRDVSPEPWYSPMWGYWQEDIDDAPTIEERKTGKWIRVDSNTFKCSKCGNFLNFHGVNAGRGDANYCPNCGAKMEVDE